jgi:alpha-galactosidase
MGLCNVKEAAAKMGANLMIWFEPERAIIGTPITEEHPEWFIELPNSRSKILNYANSDARNYICSLISDYIEKLGMSCYRQDFNTRYTDCFKKNDEENRRGITEIKQITGMYEMWDTLLERFPHLIIDNCSGGGRRIDIETLKRSIPFFRSDYQCAFNENPEVLQVHNSGISHYLPYNGCTSKTKADTYAIRSSYSSSWGGAFYNAIFQEMSEEDFVWAKKITEEYRSIRKYFSMDFYNHGSKIFDDTAWTVWQYHDPDTDSGIIMAFRRENSPFDTVKIELRGLSEGERVFTSLNDGEVSEGNSTITVTLPEKRSSAIIEYRKK